MGLFRSFYGFGDTENLHTVYPTVRLAISDSDLLTYEKNLNFKSIFLDSHWQKSIIKIAFAGGKGTKRRRD
jgi:hypothetical protein